ncbi:MAG: hypothetical protein P1P83_13190 [Bacteroidales bacterium]|nr:hypothetical protein [Bacteroidales bacterium]
MKKLIITSILAVLVAAGAIVRGQDWPEEYLGLPGDNMNLYAVMNLFQESKTLEEFERNLNASDSRVNNLDLNGDNFIDYITVTDYVDGKIHTIVLRAVLGRNDFQDVAVFIVERKNKNKVRIQLIGDEMLYGRNYVIEPKVNRPNPGYQGDPLYYDDVIYVGNVYYYDLSWPVLDWMFMPSYVAWHSGWYWGYWPAYWKPWSPWYWHHYYGYHYNWYPHYYTYYHHWNHLVHHYYNDFYYTSVRHYSKNVEHRKTEGHYKQTYTRPESRRDGEELYRKVYASRDSRSAVISGDSRRSAADQAARVPTQSTVSSDRRSPDAATRSREEVSRSREAVSRSRESVNSQAAATDRRNPAEVKSTTVTRPSAPDRAEVIRREAATAPERSSYSAPARSSSSSVSSAPSRSTSSSSNTRSSYSAPVEKSSVSSAPARSSSSSEAAAPARRR